LWIENLVKLLSKREAHDYYNAARTFLRKLWEAKILKACTMQAICLSVFNDAQHAAMKEQFKEYSILLDSSQKKIDKVIDALRDALEEEQKFAQKNYGIAAVNEECILASELGGNSFLAVKEMKTKAAAHHSLKKFETYRRTLLKLAVSLAKEKANVDGREISMHEISPILMAMHEVITGTRLPESSATGKTGHYSPVNLQKEVDRLEDPVNLRSFREIEIGMRRKSNDQPPTAKVSVRCHKIISCAEDFHDFCLKNGDPRFDLE
jgi:hypothetical protein